MTYPPNIAYVTYGPVGTTQTLNPFWQQLSQLGASNSVDQFLYCGRYTCCRRGFLAASDLRGLDDSESACL